MISDEFRQNVESGNVETVRSALLDYLIIDTSFRKFNEALAYAKESVNVIEVEDGRQEYEEDPNHWDEAYLNRQKVALMINFSQKRIRHLQNVIRKVFGEESRTVGKPLADRREGQKSQEGRTSRTVLSETAIRKPGMGSKGGSNPQTDTKAQSDEFQNLHMPEKSRRTGREVIGEKRLNTERTEEEVHLADRAARMIKRGIAMAAIGGAAAGIGAWAAKPIVVYTGLAIAGVGGVMAGSGGVIIIIEIIKIIKN